MSHPAITTERLTLRRWQEADLEPFAQICADPEVMRFIGDGSTRTREQTQRTIEHFEAEWEEYGFGLFAVELTDTAEFIGFTGLSVPDFMPELLPSIEIGWRLGRPFWGKGYATEAAKAALGFAMTELPDQQIVSICQVGNTASIRIMEKIGLRRDRRSLDKTCNREVEVFRLPS